jgi:hypothetical protein
LWQLGPQDATRQVGQDLGILLAAEQRLEHLTTANPRTLLAIIASFTTLKISSSVASWLGRAAVLLPPLVLLVRKSCWTGPTATSHLAAGPTPSP